MGLFFNKKKEKKIDFDDIYEHGRKNARTEEERRYYEALADKQYQFDRSQFYDLSTEIKEDYAVINNLGSFDSEAGNKLIDKCVMAITIDEKIREKRDYYDSAIYENCEPYKILSMVFEKRGEYENAAAVCVLAIEKGYTKDGTSGGMRGRLARMIKKGSFPLTDNIRKILNL